MKHTKLASLCLATAGLLAAVNPAAAVTVDLNSLSLGDSTSIETGAPGFGDDGPVTVNWNPTSAGASEVLFWNGGYSGRNAGWCQVDASCLIDLTVASGFEITLDSFSLGGYLNTDRTIAWSVTDLATNIAIAGSHLVSGLTGTVIAPGLTSGTGFRISFGPDGYNGGITQIDYSYARVAAVPLPAAGFLLLGALGGMAALRRRKAVTI